MSSYIGFLCGKCTKGPDNTGIALNLIECVPCDASDIVYFVLICKSTFRCYTQLCVYVAFFSVNISKIYVYMIITLLFIIIILHVTVIVFNPINWLYVHKRKFFNYLPVQQLDIIISYIYIAVLQMFKLFQFQNTFLCRHFNCGDFFLVHLL